MKSKMITLLVFFILCLHNITGQTTQVASLDELINQGDTNYKKGFYFDAEILYRKSLDIQSKQIGNQHPDYASTLNKLAKTYYRKGQYPKSDSLFQEVLRIRTEKCGNSSLEYAESCNDYGHLLLALQKPDAENFLIKAVNIRKKEKGEKSPEYAESIMLLGSYYSMFNQLEKANDLLKKSSDIFLKTKGEASVEYTSSIYFSGIYCIYKGELLNALKYLIQTTNINRKVLGNDHPFYAENLLCMTTLYGYMGDYKACEPLFEEALSIYEKHFQKIHPDCAAALVNMGGIYLASGNYEKAEPVLNEAFQLVPLFFGKQHQHYFNLLNSLAKLYLETGRMEKAESFYLESLQLRIELFGDKHPSVINALNSLGHFYMELGNYSSAEEYLLRASQTLGKSQTSPYYTMVMFNLSTLYRAQGKDKKEFEYWQKAMDGYSGEQNETYISFLQRYVRILEKADNDHEAIEKEHWDLLQKTKKILGENHPTYGSCLFNLAFFYKKIGKYDQALPLFNQALSIYKNTQGEYESYSECLFSTADCYERIGDLPQAINCYVSYIEFAKKRVENNFAFLSEKERAFFINSTAYTFDFFRLYFSVHYKKYPELSIHAYNNVLFTKSLLLTSSKYIQQAILNSKNNDLIESWNNYSSIKKEIIRLESQPIAKQTGKAELEKQAEQLEKKLIRDSQAYNQWKEDVNINWQTIQKVLEKEDVAIEFVHYELLDENNTKENMYYALVLRSNYDRPQLIVLGSTKEIESALKSNKTTSTTYNLIWKPLEEKLSGVKHIYLAPSGLLNGISFSGIKKGDHYLCDEFKIHNLLSTKDIISLKNKQKEELRNQKAILFGGADYRLFYKNWEPIKTEESSVLRSEFIPLNKKDSLMRGQGFAYLPGSKDEVERIQKHLASLNWEATSFTGNTATETWFKSFSVTKNTQSPQLIHISTHGFYLPFINTEKEIKKQLPKSNIYRLSQNPLMRTGLAFTGANLAWSGELAIENIDDGILTAYEVSNMNLSNTELVVLSACDTGLGEINGSEGVYGLQRAFRLAGVQSMIVSLWKVPDKETVELMDEFYAQWTKGINKKEAFTNAQRILRNQYPQNPEKWAGFIMIE